MSAFIDVPAYRRMSSIERLTMTRWIERWAPVHWSCYAIEAMPEAGLLLRVWIAARNDEGCFYVVGEPPNQEVAKELVHVYLPHWPESFERQPHQNGHGAERGHHQPQ